LIPVDDGSNKLELFVCCAVNAKPFYIFASCTASFDRLNIVWQAGLFTEQLLDVIIACVGVN